MTIERAAKAIYNSIPGSVESWPIWRAEEIARAALDAIAEPTPEMIWAGKFFPHDSLTEMELRWLWRAMHAAMMKEGK